MRVATTGATSIFIIILNFIIAVYRLWQITIHNLGVRPILSFSLPLFASDILLRSSSYFSLGFSIAYWHTSVHSLVMGKIKMESKERTKEIEEEKEKEKIVGYK